MATLVKPPLFPEVESMERRLRRMFEATPLTAFTPTATPAVDIYETPKEYVVELEVPGYTREQLGIAISDHTLTITGTRAEAKEETEKTYARAGTAQQGRDLELSSVRGRRPSRAPSL